jgi:hypothetical protein
MPEQELDFGILVSGKGVLGGEPNFTLEKWFYSSDPARPGYSQQGSWLESSTESISSISIYRENIA